ncbi:factor H binding protein domain-containing protein [Neisseria dumasiana]|nr:factor H binding protein domain-containing protein [Neisseria dumasiana]
MKKTSLFMCAFSALLLAACGSSGNNAPSAQSTPNAAGMLDPINKQEDTKQEDTKQEDTKQEDTKQEDKKQEENAPSSQQSSNGYPFLVVPNLENEEIGTIVETINGKPIINGKIIASNYQIQLNGKTYRSKDKIDISSLQLGLNTLPFKESISQTIEGLPSQQAAIEGNLRLYKQHYSVLTGTFVKKKFNQASPEDTENENTFSFDNGYAIQGDVTPFKMLPTEGVYTYNGKAFDEKAEGTLQYTIDFEKRVGSGSITGMKQFGDIKLNQASIKQITEEHPVLKNGGEIEGTAVSEKLGKGEYALGIFGPKAEEIVGVADFVIPGDSEQEIEQQDVEIGFGGQR